jgi:hypothetical protein
MDVLEDLPRTGGGAATMAERGVRCNRQEESMIWNLGLRGDGRD